MTETSEDLLQLPPELRARGRDLGLRLYALVRVHRMHGERNEAFADAASRLIEEVELLRLHGGGHLELRFSGEVLTLNGAVVKAAATGAEQLAELAALFAERGVGGLRFERAPNAELLAEWIRLFDRPSGADAGPLATLARLDPLGLVSLPPRVLEREDLGIVRVSSLSFALQTFGRAVVGFREVVRALAAGRDPYLGKLSIVRVGQDMVDIAAAHPRNLVETLARARAAPTLRSAGQDDLPRHAASVMTWSLLVGAELGYDRVDLLELGLCALLSRTGYALLPRDRVEVPVEYGTEAREALRLEMLEALDALIAKSPPDEATLRRLVVAYELGRPFAETLGLHPYARIVAVADAYDALCSPRPWRPALPAAEAGRVLARESGRRFDPAALAALARARAA